MTHEVHPTRRPAGYPGSHRLLPIAGVTAAIVAVLAHLGGGAALMHLGLGALLAYVGADAADLGGAALLLVLAAVISVKLLLVFGARRWWRHR